MNMSLNGFGDMNSMSAMTGTLSIKENENAVKRMDRYAKAAKKTRKKLNYNYREVSGQILKAKKAQSAAVALSKAKSKLANLQRAVGTGQYDTKELASAIAHARRIVSCAQLKVRNLKEEEAERKGHKKESSEKVQQNQNEIKRRTAQKERELINKAALEQMQLVQQEKSRRQEMLQKRRMHRNEERGKISGADMKYIKDQREGVGGETQDNRCILDGVFLELSQSKAPLTEEQIAEQVEQEIDAGIGNVTAAINSADASVVSANESGSAAGSIMDGGMGSGTVDISI